MKKISALLLCLALNACSGDTIAKEAVSALETINDISIKLQPGHLCFVNNDCLMNIFYNMCCKPNLLVGQCCSMFSYISVAS